MATEVTVRLSEALEYVVKLREYLEDPRSLLKQLGAATSTQAQRAFREESFDGVAWPSRYPNQGDPVVNLAGVVQDLEEGYEKPKSHRFDRKPAGKDSGNLWRSLADKSTVDINGKYTVTVGSTVAHASKFQVGGLHSQPVSGGTKDKIARFIETPEGSKYSRKLAFMTAEDFGELTTDAVPRQYIGMTSALGKRFVRIAEGKLVELKPRREIDGG